MSWTEERTETLTKLAAKGDSASQIAAQLGGVSRNAVIGKAHRMGISLSGKPPGKPKQVKNTKPPQRRRPSVSTKGGAPVLSIVPEKPKATKNLLEAALRIPRKFNGVARTLLTVQENECRTPLAYEVEPDTSPSDQPLCARPTEDNETLCTGHITIFTKKGVPNRRKATKEPRRIAYQR